MHKILFFILCILNYPFNVESFEWNGFNFQAIESCSGSKVCLSKDDVTKLVLEHSLENRIKFESLLRARAQIMVKMGKLLPSISMEALLDIGMIVGSVNVGVNSIVSSFLGFLIPSRWFVWKESKMLFRAEQESYLNLKANSINIIENIFYQVQREYINTQIYSYYLSQLKIIQNILKLRSDAGMVSEDEMINLDLKIQRLDMLQNQSKQNYNSFINELLYAISYSPEKDWHNVGIVVQFPYQNFLPNPIKEDQYKQKVQDLSYELKTLHYMYQASLYAKKAQKYDFLSLGGSNASSSDSNLGFGYTSTLKIKKSESRTIKLREEQTKTDLVKGLHTIGIHYNQSIEMLKRIENAIIYNDKLGLFAMLDFKDSFDINIKNLINLIFDRIEWDIAKNTLAHMYAMAKSNFSRILLDGVWYETVKLKQPQTRATKQRHNNL